jgi:hypothetical protein
MLMINRASTDFLIWVKKYYPKLYDDVIYGRFYEISPEQENEYHIWKETEGKYFRYYLNNYDYILEKCPKCGAYTVEVCNMGFAPCRFNTVKYIYKCRNCLSFLGGYYKDYAEKRTIYFAKDYKEI